MAAAARRLVQIGCMLGPIHHESGSHWGVADAAAIRLLLATRAERAVEPAGDGGTGRRCDEERRCPPPERVPEAPGAIPFDRYLEKRNREDTVEFSLGARAKECAPAWETARGRECCEPCEPPPGARGRALDGAGPSREAAGRWPRLGEVSPVEPAKRRRVEAVYRVAVRTAAGRIDLIG